MARPIKNNADYFPHDADMRNDPRIKALRRKFGIEGYGVYSMLLEFLTDSDYFEFKNDSLSMELIAGDFDIETDRLTNILQYCFQIDLFQLDAETNNIRCKSLDNRLNPLLSKRKRDRNDIIDSDNTQSRVEESKVNKIKANEIGEKEETLPVIGLDNSVKKLLNDELWIHNIRHLTKGKSLEGAARSAFLFLETKPEKFKRADLNELKKTTLSWLENTKAVVNGADQPKRDISNL